MIPVDESTRVTIVKELRKMPPVLNRVYEPKLRAAYETGLDGVVLVFIDYGPLALHGVFLMHEPDLQFYLDLHSMFLIISTMVENAITEYDNGRVTE